MPEILAQAFAYDGLIWLVLAVLVAGIVRGFSGFGSAMIIMPVASSVLSPVEAVIFLAAAEVLGPLPNLPGALRDGSRRDVGLLLAGALLALPFGLWYLSYVDPDIFGWMISFIVLVLLVFMVTGWRYRGAMSAKLIFGTGSLGGILTGLAGIPGPPMIMLYMASTLPIATIRANSQLYLLGIDVMLFLLLLLSGLMVWKAALLGLLIGVPYLLANAVGARLFNPQAEGTFRLVAYAIIACSAILGLPLWKG